MDQNALFAGVTRLLSCFQNGGVHCRVFNTSKDNSNDWATLKNLKTAIWASLMISFAYIVKPKRNLYKAFEWIKLNALLLYAGY